MSVSGVMNTTATNNKTTNSGNHLKQQQHGCNKLGNITTQRNTTSTMRSPIKCFSPSTSSSNSLKMSIEAIVNENSDIRHHKLLQNIVKILKINDLLEEYRSAIRNLQTQCVCKRAKPAWEQISLLEIKYKELLVESCRSNNNVNNNSSSMATIGKSHSNWENSQKIPILVGVGSNNNDNNILGTTSSNKNFINQNLTKSNHSNKSSSAGNLPSGNNNSKRGVLLVGHLSSSSSSSMDHHQSHNNHHSNSHHSLHHHNHNSNHNHNQDHTLQNYRVVFDQSGQKSQKFAKVNSTNVRSPIILLTSSSKSSLVSGNEAIVLNQTHPNVIEIDSSVESNGGVGGGSSNNATDKVNSLMGTNASDDNDLIEEEEVLEDEEDDDVEEELDIEEYMALSEILENENSQNKFEKEKDAKNDFILAVRNIGTKEVICYECTVGGNCGFLSRERSRMLLHIQKHFLQQQQQLQKPNQSLNNGDDDDGDDEDDDEDDEDDDQDDEDQDDESSQISINRLRSSNDIDISVIPVDPEVVAIKHLHNLDKNDMVIFKEESNASKFSTASSVNSAVSSISPSVIKLFNHHSVTTNQPSSASNRPQPIINQGGSASATSSSMNHRPCKPGNKPIKCEWDNCAFMCDQNYKLRTHIRQVHEKVRPYLCDWPGCFGAYKTRSNLASHRMVHTGERPFVCDYPRCGAKFARKYDCERHRRIHSEKMYACEWPNCGKRLCDPYNLERHMMVHKGELPFRCPVMNCVRGFRELRYLRDHMVTCHKFLPDTNQLRMACRDSSKMVSITGYNLNETSIKDEINNGGASGGGNVTPPNSNSDVTNTIVMVPAASSIVSKGSLKRKELSDTVSTASSSGNEETPASLSKKKLDRMVIQIKQEDDEDGNDHHDDDDRTNGNNSSSVSVTEQRQQNFNKPQSRRTISTRSRTEKTSGQINSNNNNNNGADEMDDEMNDDSNLTVEDQNHDAAAGDNDVTISVTGNGGEMQQPQTRTTRSQHQIKRAKRSR